jgi:hypothetical protein
MLTFADDRLATHAPESGATRTEVAVRTPSFRLRSAARRETHRSQRDVSFPRRRSRQCSSSKLIDEKRVDRWVLFVCTAQNNGTTTSLHLASPPTMRTDRSSTNDMEKCLTSFSSLNCILTLLDEQQRKGLRRLDRTLGNDFFDNQSIIHWQVPENKLFACSGTMPKRKQRETKRFSLSPISALSLALARLRSAVDPSTCPINPHVSFRTDKDEISL